MGYMGRLLVMTNDCLLQQQYINKSIIRHTIIAKVEYTSLGEHTDYTFCHKRTLSISTYTTLLDNKDKSHTFLTHSRGIRYQRFEVKNVH